MHYSVSHAIALVNGSRTYYQQQFMDVILKAITHLAITRWSELKGQICLIYINLFLVLDSHLSRARYCLPFCLPCSFFFCSFRYAFILLFRFHHVSYLFYFSFRLSFKLFFRSAFTPFFLSSLSLVLFFNDFIPFEG